MTNKRNKMTPKQAARLTELRRHAAMPTYEYKLKVQIGRFDRVTGKGVAHLTVFNRGSTVNFQGTARGMDFTIDWRKLGPAGMAIGAAIEDALINHILDEARSGERLAYLRARTAARTKNAADIRRVLYPLFQKVAPFVKNYDRFLMRLGSDLSSGWDNILDEWAASDMQVIYWGSEILPGDIEHNFPEEVQVVCTSSVSLRDLPPKMLGLYSKMVTDRRGFTQAVADLTGNSAAMTMLGKILASGIKSEVKKGPLEFIEDTVIDELTDFAVEAAKGENLSWITTKWELPPPWKGEDGKVKKTWFKLTGQDLQVSAQVLVPGEATMKVQPD